MDSKRTVAICGGIAAVAVGSYFLWKHLTKKSPPQELQKTPTTNLDSEQMIVSFDAPPEATVVLHEDESSKNLATEPSETTDVVHDKLLTRIVNHANSHVKYLSDNDEITNAEHIIKLDTMLQNTILAQYMDRDKSDNSDTFTVDVYRYTDTSLVAIQLKYNATIDVSIVWKYNTVEEMMSFLPDRIADVLGNTSYRLIITEEDIDLIREAINDSLTLTT